MAGLIVKNRKYSAYFGRSIIEFTDRDAGDTERERISCAIRMVRALRHVGTFLRVIRMMAPNCEKRCVILAEPAAVAEHAGVLVLGASPSLHDWAR